MSNTGQISEDISRRIENLVEFGRFDDANDVLREGLRLVEERAGYDAAKVDALREAAALGFADIEQGRFTDVPLPDLSAHIAHIGREAVRRAGKRAEG